MLAKHFTMDSSWIQGTLRLRMHFGILSAYFGRIMAIWLMMIALASAYLHSMFHLYARNFPML